MVDFEIAQYFECRVAEIWSEEDMIFIKFRKGVEVTLDDLKVMNELTTEIRKGKMVRILTDLRGMTSITKEARDFGASSESIFKDLIVANAMLVGDPISTIIGHLILRVDAPPHPTRLFTNSAEAKDWLGEFKPQ